MVRFTMLAAVAAAGVAQADVEIRSVVTNGVEVRWFEEMVPMKDGTRLYTYGVLPPAGETRGIVFRRNPYVEEKPVDMPAYAWSQHGALKRGYAYVEQHVRGTGMSEGSWVPYENEREDGLATLEWLRRLPHYCGEIFLSGGSYLSSVHFSYLSTNPPDVKGAALFIQDVNRYNVAYRNGFFKIGLHGNWFVKGYRKKDKSLCRNRDHGGEGESPAVSVGIGFDITHRTAPWFRLWWRRFRTCRARRARNRRPGRLRP